ncbi:U3 small nucleolar ribonucleoprotein protein MPP10 [Anopheles stephensi]|uniref:U3 small nucleolar ribonucleoprotein protein MPP10 n=1 Tax=Anopheles stephensi TaxID=30069 RepID=UPI0016589D7E|nr:U3 small nucleolar ribonucleoprotein protein MPP10 [Anopheles stephensi]
MVKSTALSPPAADKILALKPQVTKFRKYTKYPGNYLKLQKPLAKKLKLLVKQIYDHGTKNPIVGHEQPLPYLDELVTEEMDNEQIWQQLELKNDHFIEQDLKQFLDVVSKNEKRLQLAYSTKPASQVDGSDDGSMSADEAHDESDEENGINGDGMDSEDEENEANGNGMDSDEAEEAPRKAKKQKKKEKKQSKAKKSVVDDRFFRLDDMAKFLDEEDERERRKQYGLAERNPLIEIDYFDEHTGEDGEDGADLKYADFFDDEDDEEDDSEDDEEDEDAEDEEEDEDMENEANSDDAEVEDEEEDENDKEPKQDDGELSDEAEMERNRKLRFEIYKGEGGFPSSLESPAKRTAIDQPDSSDSESEDEKKQGKDDGPKSSYELRQEKLKEKITQMESKLLKDKPWQLKGEISAETRPKNSLLEEVLEYEHTTRPAPVITEETTMRLEDIIKQRIRNKAFDDVERKVRPPENPREYRKQLVLDGEKSKESLAKVYEQDYLKQLEKANPDADVQANEEEEEPKEHKEIRQMMKVVLAQLDALSNFHYTPRPAAPELKILTNTPAISMEEVAPVATSDANLLAPEEVHRRPKGDVMSKEERTKTDQNRERRLKKRFQQAKFRREAEREQKQLEKAGNNNSKQNRALQTSLLKKVTKAKNVQQMVETSSGPAKSSSAFFSQLQDEVRSQVKAKADGTVKKKKKNTDNLIASSLKL